MCSDRFLAFDITLRTHPPHKILIGQLSTVLDLTAIPPGDRTQKHCLKPKELGSKPIKNKKPSLRAIKRVCTWSPDQSGLSERTRTTFKKHRILSPAYLPSR